MKIEAGKFYRTRDGQKIGPMTVRFPHDRDGDVWGVEGDTWGMWSHSGRAWTEGGHETPEDLISEWSDAPQIDLTAITTPLGLLDAETREALKAHGGPYEYVTTNGWTDWGVVLNITGAHHHLTIRVKPQPPKPREWWITDGNCAWETLDEALRAHWNPTHVREVLPD